MIFDVSHTLCLCYFVLRGKAIKACASHVAQRRFALLRYLFSHCFFFCASNPAFLCIALSFAFKSTSLWPTRSYAIIHHFPNEVNQAVIFGENPVLLDVREPDEHKKERIIGTVNVPLSVIKASQEDLSDISFKR